MAAIKGWIFALHLIVLTISGLIAPIQICCACAGSALYNVKAGGALSSVDRNSQRSLGTRAADDRDPQVAITPGSMSAGKKLRVLVVQNDLSQSGIDVLRDKCVSIVCEPACICVQFR